MRPKSHPSKGSRRSAQTGDLGFVQRSRQRLATANLIKYGSPPWPRRLTAANQSLLLENPSSLGIQFT
ncbi:uncharacterized protein PADG_12363 [Paracoccidioides brasiliensis Pb18]|uniref:Uncharacterized protein n=2 Tax=Paracoccidioides brasiliensis TaxID=121759 RepID=A0A0A0HVP0_PARBD|nr:uncharacterized protein PADG_12363 [Paracoccidioides brasiliensis Pb18]KGM91505.1 hypothetical protein PADG_12363 [Paracoccidioides brasiliensis Pb18]